MIKRVFFLLLLCLDSSQILNAETVKQAHTEVELIADVESVQPGSQFKAGILFRMDPDWHIYWLNPGDSGMTPEIIWQLPFGVTVGEIEWPYPHLISQPPLASYGYEKEVLLGTSFEVSTARSPDESIVLKAKLDWLACKVECIPGKAELSLALPVIERTDPSEHVGLFSKTKFDLPLFETDWGKQAYLRGETIIIGLRAPPGAAALSQVHFFPENPQWVQHAAAQPFKKTSTGSQLEIPLALNHPQITTLRGTLVSTTGWRGPGSEKAWQINIPLTEPPVAALSWLTALIFAFLGGLILNLMPCVLPVLSLKILNFVNEAAENPKRVWKHGLVFTAGVLISFWILAGILIALQMAGSQVGWGFQLQSPVFVGILCIFFFIFALNLFGFFEIGVALTGVGGSWMSCGGLWGSFGSGILATVVATPCTAPFMGAALGFALSQPAWIALLVFTAVGLGMAAPYLILCANPRWLKFVPRPGPWMNGLKKILGILLLLTAFWLGWILSVQTGIFAKLSSHFQFTENKIDWQPYSAEKFAELRALKKPIFIDFTAAWCLTCQVNERVALDRKQVAGIFREKGINALKADWTRRDEAITKALAEYGRNSIPFYVLYSANAAKAPVFLPEILTPAIVIEALQKMDD